jgi:hypothetical protein
MPEAQTAPVDPEVAAKEAAAAEEAAKDPKNWTPAKRLGASYIPTLEEYVKSGYKAEDYDAFVSNRAKEIEALGLTPHSNRLLRPEGPHYIVEAALQATRKNLNMHQRNSSWFSEAPRIGDKVLRRGVKVHLTEGQKKVMDLQLRRLHMAHAIEIYKVDEDGNQTNLRDVPDMSDAKAVMDGPKTPAGGTELPPDVTAAEAPLVDPDKTQQVQVIPPAEALKGGPDPTVFPVNPAADATDSELDAAADAVGEDDGGKVEGAPKKKSKRSSKKEG